jgi:hypothetical protein
MFRWYILVVLGSVFLTRLWLLNIDRTIRLEVFQVNYLPRVQFPMTGITQVVNAVAMIVEVSG